jgi:hypothetical protein
MGGEEEAVEGGIPQYLSAVDGEGGAVSDDVRGSAMCSALGAHGDVVGSRAEAVGVGGLEGVAGGDLEAGRLIAVAAVAEDPSDKRGWGTRVDGDVGGVEGCAA